MAIKTMFIDQDIDQLNEVAKYFGSSSSINVVNLASCKEDAMDSIDNSDVIVIDMLLSGLDSLDLLKEITNNYKNKIIIATSEFISSDMMKNISKYHINYFIKKPFQCETLESIILALHKEDVVNENASLKVEITNMLHSLGIPSHIKGYNYIRDGVELLYNNSSLIGAITKELYPTIASTYDTTSSRVERAIRHAIEVSWMRGDYDMMEELFGNSVDYDRSKPTNSEFIVTLADRLKLNNNV